MMKHRVTINSRIKGSMMTQRERLLADTLRDILKIAQDCRSEAQGRLADEEHHRMFLVLGSIQNRASVALS